MLSRKPLDLTIPEHVDEMRKLLEEDEDDPVLMENLGDESDVASEDELVEREDDTDTEQEGETDEEDENAESFFLGRDKQTKWNRKPTGATVRTISHLPCVKGNASSCKTALECWRSLFSDEMLEQIAIFTNQYMDTIRVRLSRERDMKPTDLCEIRAFIGLLYLAGAYKGNRQSLEELWGKEGDGVEKFNLVMSIKRFKTILRCIRFDDRNTREERKAVDRLAPISDLFDSFILNCQESYNLGQNITFDEMLLRFRGKCPFRQYNPAKATKYGIKCFALVDAKMNYTYNMEVYTGFQPEGHFLINSNNSTEVIKRMVEPLFESGRNITSPHRFTDFDLIDFLQMNELYYVGTIRRNNPHLPHKFVATKGRSQFSTLFGFNGGKTLVSYVPSGNKNVILVSTHHKENSIDPASGVQKKPYVLSFYDSTKRGVETVEKMCATFDVSRNTKRWPMVIFFTMLNIAGINAQVLYLGNSLEPMGRRLFLKRLANELTMEELSRRSVRTDGMSTDLQRRLKRFRPQTLEEERQPQAVPKRRRCGTCTMETGLRRLSSYECKKCRVAICLSHANMVCDECFTTET